MLRAYDYECANGHKFEKFFTEYHDSIKCEECPTFEGDGGLITYTPAIHVWSFHYSSAHAKRFDPIHVYKDHEGKIHPCSSSTSPIPEGAQRMVLESVYDVRRVENQMNSQEQEKADKFRSARQTLTDGQLKENRRVMEGLVAKFSPRGKKFYEAMKRVSEARQQQGPRETKPVGYFDAFSNDQSNRDEYYNESIEHGSHRGRR